MVLRWRADFGVTRPCLGRLPPKSPSPDTRTPKRHWGPWSSLGPGVKKARPVKGGEGRCSGHRGRRGQRKRTPSPAEAWSGGFPRVGGMAGGSPCQGAEFLAFDLSHLCPQLQPAAPAHPGSPLRTRLLRARGVRGTGPGHQGSGEPPGLVTASAAFLARLEGAGWGER